MCRCTYDEVLFLSCHVSLSRCHVSLDWTLPSGQLVGRKYRSLLVLTRQLWAEILMRLRVSIAACIDLNKFQLHVEQTAHAHSL